MKKLNIINGLSTSSRYFKIAKVILFTKGFVLCPNAHSDSSDVPATWMLQTR